MRHPWTPVVSIGSNNLALDINTRTAAAISGRPYSLPKGARSCSFFHGGVGRLLR
jgi:hypothetical protein